MHVLYAVVPKLLNRVVLFIRLVDALDNGLEGRAPVRFMFIVFSPEAQHQRARDLCFAMAGLLSDVNFVDAAYMEDLRGFRAALVESLEFLTIAPSISIDSWLRE